MRSVDFFVKEKPSAMFSCKSSLKIFRCVIDQTIRWKKKCLISVANLFHLFTLVISTLFNHFSMDLPSICGPLFGMSPILFYLIDNYFKLLLLVLGNTPVF